MLLLGKNGNLFKFVMVHSS